MNVTWKLLLDSMVLLIKKKQPCITSNNKINKYKTSIHIYAICNWKDGYVIKN